MQIGQLRFFKMSPLHVYHGITVSLLPLSFQQSNSVAEYSSWVIIDGFKADNTWVSYYGDGPLSFLDWDTAGGEPTGDAASTCLYMRLQSNGFHDSACTHSHRALCEEQGNFSAT